MTVKLLLPYDGSPAARRAVEFLAGYAGDPRDLAVKLLNVQGRPLSLWPEASASAGSIESALVDAGRSTLAEAQGRLESVGLGAQVEVRLGIAAQTILREAKSVDAVVMGTRGAGVLQGYALGSVALRVAHGGAAPVVLVKPDDRLPAALGKRLRVLLAMDGSEPALRAAERLLAWRGWLGELDVQLAYVQRPLTLAEAVLPPHDDLVRQWSTEEAERATDKARDLLRTQRVAHHLHLTTGDPALEVRELAARTSSDLVALGTRGLGAAHHAFIGSVALKAAAAVSVPVLLVG
jgi:nucleotide-binding universal stress UspA family protein